MKRSRNCTNTKNQKRNKNEDTGDVSCGRMVKNLKNIFSSKPAIQDALVGLTPALLEAVTLKDLMDRGLDLSTAWDVYSMMKKLEPTKETSKSQHFSVKVFNDPVHGHVELPAILIRLVDTPQFQRLRDIRQLGACYYVFPGATHNRFEHSLGVAHLAGKLVRHLMGIQPELGISNIDMLCVQMAGLCHDLGHGPFSHLFDGKFMPKVLKDSKFRHEDASVRMMRYLIEVNSLWPVLEQHGFTTQDLLFVEELIAGPSVGTAYQGRAMDKHFLYEIVSNKRSGIDVDKWDYFARDCHHLGVSNNFDHHRFMKFLRVIMVDGELQICSRDKEAQNLYDMFYTRKTLHRRAYQHNVVRALEIMVADALYEANDYILTPGRDGELRTIAECVDDMEAFSQLSDRVYYQILWSRDERLAKAKTIVNRIETRQLYKFMGQTHKVQRPDSVDDAYTRYELDTFEVRIAELTNLRTEEAGNTESTILSKEDLVLDVLKLDFGMKSANPLDHVRFYRKDNPRKAQSIPRHHVSTLLPDRFAELHLRLYYKGAQDPSVLSDLQQAFRTWCGEAGFAEPKTSAQRSVASAVASPACSLSSEDEADQI